MQSLLQPDLAANHQPLSTKRSMSSHKVLLGYSFLIRTMKTTTTLFSIQNTGLGITALQPVWVRKKAPAPALPLQPSSTADIPFYVAHHLAQICYHKIKAVLKKQCCIGASIRRFQGTHDFQGSFIESKVTITQY